MDFEPYFKVHNLVSVHPKSIIQWNLAITKCHGTEKNVRHSGIFVIAKTPL